MTTDQRKDRLALDRQYNKLAAAYKEQNPACVHCGYHVGELLQTDHIVSGTAGRAASLLNPDTWNNVCPTCHDKGFTQGEKIAAKLCHVIATVERLRKQNLSYQDECLILKAIINRPPGHVR